MIHMGRKCMHLGSGYRYTKIFEYHTMLITSIQVQVSYRGGRDIVEPSYKAAISALFRIRTMITRVGRTLSEERLKDVSEAFP